MSANAVEEIRLRMEEAEARKLQPHFIRSFFIDAFRKLGGQITPREPGRFEISNVPAEIRNRGRDLGAGIPIVPRYARVTFERELVSPVGQPQAQLLAPGHALLDATVDLVLERYRPLLKQGAILVADADEGEEPRALVYVEHAIQNARELHDGQRQVVSRRLQFVELTQEWDREPRLAGYAPYLDYRPIEPDELELVSHLIAEEWLTRGVEEAARDYAITHAVPEHLEEVRGQTEARVDHTRDAVQRRLTAEIQHWDNRANELKERELAGKQARGGLNSGRARQRADELEARLKQRLTELDQERQLSPLPPVIAGGALVIPRGLLERLRGERSIEPDAHARETERVERLAVEAVLAAERGLGRHPTEMARNNKGFDIKSLTDGAGGELLFIEVKGRVAGAKEFTITKSEILTSLNKPDHFILALVRVGEDDATNVRYLRKPFPGSDDVYFDMTSANYDWDELFARGTAPL
jgi:hypothetical protein